MEVLNETRKVSVTRHDDGFIVVGVLNHRVEDELRVNIPFHGAALDLEDGFENQDVVRFLQ